MPSEPYAKRADRASGQDNRHDPVAGDQAKLIEGLRQSMTSYNRCAGPKHCSSAARTHRAATQPESPYPCGAAIFSRLAF